MNVNAGMASIDFHRGRAPLGMLSAVGVAVFLTMLFWRSKPVVTVLPPVQS
jgi:hypothetical protein